MRNGSGRYRDTVPGTSVTVDALADVAVAVVVLIAVLLIQFVAVPYVNETYHYTAETVGIDYGLSGLVRIIFTSPPTTWFQTKLLSFDLPNYAWYTALLLAVTVQLITAHIQSCIELSWVTRFHPAVQVAVRFLKAWLMTSLMMSLLTLALITVCPQNVPLLYQLFEMFLFCLPGLIHTIIRSRRPRKTRPSLWAGLPLMTVNALLALLMVGYPLVGSLLLIAADYLSTQWSAPGTDTKRMDRERPFERLAAVVISSVAIAVIGAVFIMPQVKMHGPTIETHYEYYSVKAIEADGRRAVFLRSDGAAVDQNNRVYTDHVRQVSLCTSNAFFLKDNGDLVVVSSPEYGPAPFLKDIVWTDSFDDVLIAVDGKGNLWGYGDLTGYLPEGAYCAKPTLIAENLHLVQADIGPDHILMIDGDGNLYGMGGNKTGQLGNGACAIKPQPVSQIMAGVQQAKAGNGFSLALLKDGTVWGWGRNDVGQLGTGVRIRKFTIGRGYAVNDGLAFVPEPTQLSFADTAIVQIAVGAEGAFALDSEQNMWVWGKNVNSESIAEPVKKWHSVAWIADNKVQQGVLDQICNYVADDGKAYKVAPGQLQESDTTTETIVLVYDPMSPDWMPKPVEEISTRMEEWLKSLHIFPEPEPEAAPEPIVSVIRAPERRDRSCELQFFGGHMYQIIPEYMYMKNAQSYCESMGGHLATITSAEEHQFLTAMVESTDGEYGRFFSIGLTNDQNFAWVTGESTAYLSKLNLRPAYTLENGEGYISQDGKLNVGAIIKHPFICEWDFDE